MLERENTFAAIWEEYETVKLAPAVRLAAVVLVAFGAVACGSSSKSTSGTTAAKKSGGYKVGLVTDVGGLNDHGFNQLSYQGLKRAENQLGVQGTVLVSKSSADYVPSLASLARKGNKLVIAVGFLMTDAVATVAKQFPGTKFAIIDVDATTLAGKPKNVEGLIFREQQGGYLVGYLAGLVTKHKGGKQVVGVVGGDPIPPVNRFAAGFEAGARAADPGVKTLLTYSNDFVAQPKCKELALNEIAAGAQVVFADAGGCGLGVHDAAREKNVWSIGGDADQSYLGPEILTSELKKVDVAVMDAIKGAMTGKFTGGGNLVFTAQNGGIGVGKISPKVPQSIVAQEKAELAKMAAGKIRNIPTTPTK
ncbi:MAG TPA: BMP family ABC transporter substrate-binding protein [Gaiellaceae bacterium]|nr:BMP family ABC transporter substrate-binding protein [Gaiellaceae bacterium]